MELLNNFFKGESQEFDLKNMKYLKLIKDCSDSRVIVKFKLVDEPYYVDFTAKTWNEIIRNSKKIQSALYNNFSKIFFINDELKVYTARYYDNDYRICFLNIKGTLIRLSLSSFNKLASYSGKIGTVYRRLDIEIIETIKYLKALLESVSVQCNESSSHIEKFLLNLQNHIDDLNPDKISFNIVSPSDEDSNDEDAKYCDICDQFHRV